MFTQSYCLILYTRDLTIDCHGIKGKIIIAKENQSYNDIVARLKQIADNLSQKRHKILSIGTDSLQEGFIAQEITVGFVFYEKQAMKQNIVRPHIRVHEVVYESRQSYNDLLDWVVKEVKEIDRLISVNVDAFLVPGKKHRRTHLGIPHLGQEIPTTLVALLSYYV